jgi:hypothetical protein
MHNDVHSVGRAMPPSGALDCIRPRNRVQWDPMPNEPVAAIIIIP